MADIYVAAGSATSPYDTWAKAVNLLTASTFAAAGDRVFVDKDYAASLASWAMAWAGTPANPIRIYVVDRTGDPEPPTGDDLATGATITQTGNGGAITGSIYVRGLTIIYSSSSSTTFAIGSAGGDVQLWELCGLSITGTGAATRLAFGAAVAAQDSLVKLKDCTYRFGAAGQRIGVNNTLVMEGGGFVSSSADPTGLLNLNNASRGSRALLDGVDLSELGTGFDLVTQAAQSSQCAARHCKMPSGWAGEAASASIFTGAASEVSMFQCGNTFDKRMTRKSALQGQLYDDNDFYRVGGAGGALPFSWRVETNANIAYPLNVFRSHEITYNVGVAGSPITLNIEVMTDGVTLHDEDIWPDLDFFSTTGGAPGSHIDGRRTPLDSATNWAASSETWEGEGALGSAVKQTLSVTFTPTETGIAHLFVYVARASTELWIDPEVYEA